MICSNRFVETVGTGLCGFFDPKFFLIIAFEYYDGPESGLALCSTGEGVRFSSLGDSRSRLFRAFELEFLDGLWLDEMKEIKKRYPSMLSRRVWVPAEISDFLERLEFKVKVAMPKDHYIAVGCPDLQKISVTSIDQKELNVLRGFGGSFVGFRYAHKLIKDGRIQG